MWCGSSASKKIFLVHDALLAKSAHSEGDLVLILLYEQYCRLPRLPSHRLPPAGAFIPTVDLLEHLDFDLEQFLGNLDAVNRGVEYILTSARTGRGVEDWCSWLERRKPACI